MTGSTPLDEDRRAAVDILRRALGAISTGEWVDIDRAVHQHLDGLSRQQRSRVVTTLAIVASALAAQVPHDSRERTLRAWEGPTRNLAAEGLALLLTAASEGFTS